MAITNHERVGKANRKPSRKGCMSDPGSCSTPTGPRSLRIRGQDALAARRASPRNHQACKVTLPKTWICLNVSLT